MKLFPILCGASFKNKGVQPLLDAVIDYLPSPRDIPPRQGVNPETKEIEERKAADDAPFAALAFKIMNDQHVGQLVFLRVYSGTLEAGSGVYNSTKDKKERVGRLLRMHANKKEEVEAVACGDIAAAIGLKLTTTGDTLCDADKPIVLESMTFPEKGIREALDTGVLAGYPMVDVRVMLTDGSYHDVDSSEMAFKIAASMGFKEACRKAKPVLLEPVMDVEVVTPEEYMGAIVGDLNSRRGRIASMEARGTSQVIRASVPLGRSEEHTSELQSMTQGRATYTMQFARYGKFRPRLPKKSW